VQNRLDKCSAESFGHGCIVDEYGRKPKKIAAARPPVPGEGSILDLSVYLCCTARRLSVPLSTSRKPKTESIHPSVLYPKSTVVFDGKAGPVACRAGHRRSVHPPPPRRFHGAGCRAAAAACRRFIPPQCNGTGGIARGGEWLPHARADFVRICWVRAALEEGESCVEKVPPCFASSVGRGLDKPWWVGNGRRSMDLSFVSSRWMPTARELIDYAAAGIFCPLRV
jgi:hypothetical protein